jgi:nitroimidazol reductase NimA-like FMN-containing flavoprotein (pyridoxamine 5'-phosphate oxidase superfamily)
MLIQEMTEPECLELLTSTGFGRLACARENQPYVVPFYFGYRANYIYSFATMGQKIDWMRSNALVCVETDVVRNSHEWESVVVFGMYEELPDTLEWAKEREIAQEVLQQREMWWQPAYVPTFSQGEGRRLSPIFFRIKIERMTGHRATPGS